MSNSEIDKSNEKLCGKDWILLGFILLLGISLRVIFSVNSGMVPDEAVYATRAIDFIKNTRISTMDQGPIWFSMTDLFFQVFGTTNLTARLSAILASMGIIILIFLYFYEFYKNKKMGLFSAVLFSLSNFSISQNLEIDIVMTFFMFFSIYFFIKSFRNKDTKYGFYMMLSALFLNGIATSIKTTAILVFPIYLVFIIMNFNSLSFLKKGIYIKAVLAGIAVIVPIMPILVYNYFLSKHAGVYDVIITEFIYGVKGTIYEGLAAPSFSFLNIMPNLFNLFVFLIKKDFILIVLFVLSFFFRKHIKYFSVIFSIFILEFVFMLGSSGLVKHYVNLIPLIIIMCGGVAYKIIVDISKKEMSYRKIFVFFVVLFFVQILIFNNYFHKNPQASARSFMSENIDSDKLVVLDERMYTLFGYWIANDKNPVTLINFVRLNNFYKNSTNIIEDNVYFVKCASFDCGWGTGKIEGINAYLLEVSLANFGEDWDIMAEFKDEGYDQGYAVFKAKIKYPYEVKRDAYLTNNFYYHSLSWKNPLGSFDHYMPQNKFEIIIHYSAFSILILLTIISIILFFVPLVLIYYYNKRMPNI